MSARVMFKDDSDGRFGGSMSLRYLEGEVVRLNGLVSVLFLKTKKTRKQIKCFACDIVIHPVSIRSS